MQSRGRLYTSLATFKVRSITNIDGNIITLNDTTNINASTIYKPFLIQDNNTTRIISVVSSTEVEVESASGFTTGYCYTPWANRWVMRIGDKTTSIQLGDIVAGVDTDVYQVVAIYTHGVKTAMLGLWQMDASKEPTSSQTVLYTPTSKFHMLPDSDVDIDITDDFTNNILDNLNNKYTDDSLREDIWCTVSNYTRNLYIDTSAGWFGDIQVATQTNVAVQDNSLNYIETNQAGLTVVNTTEWTDENLKIATVTTSNGIITNIEQVWIKPPKLFEDEMKFNIKPVEDPDHVRTVFTLPGSEKYKPGKLAVYTNGLREYDIVEISDTQFEICLPALHQKDILRIDYIIEL